MVGAKRVTMKGAKNDDGFQDDLDKSLKIEKAKRVMMVLLEAFLLKRKIERAIKCFCH